MAWTEPTYISGRASTDLIQSARRVVDIPDEIFYLEMDDTPLFFLAWGNAMMGKAKLKAKEAINPEFKVLSKKPHGAWVSMAGTATSAETTLTLTETPSMMKVGMIIKCPPTGEQMYVTTYSTSGNLTIGVTRGYGATTKAAMTTGDPLYIVSNANAEGADYPEIKTVQADVATNYLQIFRHAYGYTGTLENSELYGGSAESDLNKEAWLEYRKQVERAMIFGEPKEDTGTSGSPRRTTGGAVYWIGSDYTQTGVTLSTTTFGTFNRNLFRYGSKTKIALCSPLVIDALDNFKDGKLEMRPSDEAYNIKVARWETGHGTLLIARDVMLEDSPYGSTTEGYGGSILALDPSDLSMRYLRGRNSKLLRNRQGNGEDKTVHEYLGELGLQLNNPAKHRWWTGITTY